MRNTKRYSVLNCTHVNTHKKIWLFIFFWTFIFTYIILHTQDRRIFSTYWYWRKHKNKIWLFYFFELFIFTYFILHTKTPGTLTYLVVLSWTPKKNLTFYFFLNFYFSILYSTYVRENIYLDSLEMSLGKVR